jgi:anaerobic selenocysteine-containing dehydrogenase
MISNNNHGLSRRKFVKLSAAAAQGMAIIPGIAHGSG